MDNIKVSFVKLTPIETNCYIVFTEDRSFSAVVDPGDFSKSLVHELDRCGVESLTYILLTHGHFDHIGGAAELQKEFGGKIVISKIDEASFSDPSLSLSGNLGSIFTFPEKADITVSDGDRLSFGKETIQVLSTPGHTSGSVCYMLSDMIFSGDTLFASSCGRTDFKTGNTYQMMDSLQKLAALEGDYKIYPGHMGFSTLEKERKTNPYINIRK